MPSGLDNSTGRLAARRLQITPFRPEPPREFRAGARNVLRWLPPQEKNFTHYYLRVDQDDGEPDYVFPSGQTAFQIQHGKRFFLSCFNESVDLESGQAILDHDAETLLGGAGGGAFETLLYEVAVLGSGTVPATTETPEDGQLLIWCLTMDAAIAAGITLLWNAQYKNAPIDTIDPTANTLTVVEFFGRTGSWYFLNMATGLSDL